MKRADITHMGTRKFVDRHRVAVCGALSFSFAARPSLVTCPDCLRKPRAIAAQWRRSQKRVATYERGALSRPLSAFAGGVR